MEDYSWQTSFPQLQDVDDGEDLQDEYNDMMMRFDEEDQEFLRDIMQQPGRHHHLCLSSQTTETDENSGISKDKNRMISPRAYIMSFENSQLDKATILDEAVKYVKQLEERVRELEKELSVTSIKRVELCDENEDLCEAHEEVPKIEVRVSENQLLFGIHCEKQKGIEFKILSSLENFHLCVTGCSILPFGDSILGITITAQVGDECGMQVNEVVKELRQVLSKSHEEYDSY